VYYDVSFTIPANTAKASPKEDDVKLTHGVIHRVEIGFPSGCRGLAHVQIRHGLHQVWPTNPDGDFRADRYTIPINDYYQLLEEPYILTLVGWNLDDTYDHTLEMRFGILPPGLLLAQGPVTLSLRNITEEVLL
jgi:hypothetical protein